jgi:hypothetical protein
MVSAVIAPPETIADSGAVFDRQLTGRWCGVTGRTPAHPAGTGPSASRAGTPKAPQRLGNSRASATLLSSVAWGPRVHAFAIRGIATHDDELWIRHLHGPGGFAAATAESANRFRRLPTGPSASAHDDPGSLGRGWRAIDRPAPDQPSRTGRRGGVVGVLAGDRGDRPPQRVTEYVRRAPFWLRHLSAVHRTCRRRAEAAVAALLALQRRTGTLDGLSTAVEN